ncbi:MAG: histidine kinase [Clostridia bacterium]|nr:histidine kinase [Clostridia bacterium]
MKKQMSKRIREFLPIILIGIVILLFILSGIGDYRILSGDISMLQSDWRVNGEKTAVLPQFLPEGGPISLDITLDDRFNAKQALCFYSSCQDVDVYLNGENIYSLRKPEQERITKAAPSIWNMVYLPENCEGGELRIELSSPYREYEGRIPEFYFGSPHTVTRYISMKTVPLFVASLGVLFVGLIFSLISANVRQHISGQTGLYTLSLFIVSLSVFLTTQQTTVLMNIYDGTNYIFLQHVSLMICPVLYSRYMMRTSKGVVRKIAFWLMITSAVNMATVMLLQLLRVMDLPEMFISTRVLCVAMIIYVFVLEMKMQRRIVKLLFVSLLAYVLIRFYFTGTVTYEVYLGLFGYLYVIIYRVVAEVVRAKARQIRLEGELEASRSEIAIMQITSHFFYHTLDSIRALIRLDSDKAYKMTGDFAKYIRHRVDGMDSRQETVSFAKELRSIRAYTDIKQAQLGDRFKMVFDIETDEFEILALSVQPLVENAVIHAMQLRREGGMICLNCRETQYGYHIEVIDNGCGAKPADHEEHEQKRSVAIENVNKRLEYYGIAPLEFNENELGGMTASMNVPKKIIRKGNAE